MIVLSSEKEFENESGLLPQYQRIAADIASRIAEGKLEPNRYLAGKSTLSSEYGVSGETVRKAIRLLADSGVVQVKEGSRTVVVSADAAKGYLESIRLREEQVNLRDQLRTLFENYNNLGKKILEVSDSLIASSSTPLPEDQKLPFYEVTVPESSDKVDMTIGDLRFWQCTGATIVAIKRGQNIQVSPGPYAILRPEDVIVYVGPPESQSMVQQLLTSGKTESTLYHIQEQINTAMHVKELAVVAEFLDANLGDITDFVAMTKGMTNHSYRFTCRGERYILRIPGEGTGYVISRTQEAAVYRAIAGTGICDDVVYLNPANGLKVTKYLEGVRTCDPYNEYDLKKCMTLLRRFHTIGLQVDHSFDIYGNIEFYESLWEEMPSVYPDYAETKANILSLQPWVESVRGPLCLTHIDAVPDNFLFHPKDGDENLQLTDWEYSGMQDPHVDIAMFCLYSMYDREHVDRLIDIYFENECPHETRIKIYCYIASCGLLWSNWSEYKRKLGINYDEYGRSQYNYAREYFDIVRKEIFTNE